MKKELKNIGTIFLLTCILILSMPINLYAQNETNKTLKVGFYNYEPYYYMNKDGKPDGFYNDLLELLKRDVGIEYEYMMLDVSKCIERLETGEIDLLLGINKTPDREQKFIYTDHYIDVEKYGIYTNKDIDYGKLQELENLRFAFVENEENSNWIYEFLQEKNINTEPVNTTNYEEAKQMLLDETVDAITYTITDSSLRNKNKIYEYSAGPVYIAASKGNEELILKINNMLEEYSRTSKNPLEEIKGSYFGKSINKDTIMIMSLTIVLLIGIVMFMVLNRIYPIIKNRIVITKIRSRMIKNKYMLYYQPIIDPKRGVLVGFEALLRLKDSKGNILSPYLFIKEIEENDMMSEVSIWILKKILTDYKKIQSYNNINNKEFYISMNVSSKDMENKEFINEAVEIIKNNKIPRSTICMEIVESMKINNLSNMKDAIDKLHDSGIKIAIDDFGVEHSNLDTIEKLKFDILKLDKYFIDGVEISKTRREIIELISRLSATQDKVIIAEGVETEGQRQIIKNMDNQKLYIQGYVYSKPICIEEVNNISL